MKVFLICLIVDNGYHVKHVYLDHAEAIIKCLEMNKLFQAKQIEALMETLKMTRTVAEKYVKQIYFIEEHYAK